MYEMLLMNVKQRHVENVIKFFISRSGLPPLLTVHCAVGFSCVSLFVSVLNDKQSYKKI